MKKKIGILTSGGDCPGLNATIRAIAKACYQKFGADNIEIIGISDGFSGLIYNDTKVMSPENFSGILTQGGTILGTKRTPFRMMTVVEDNIDKIRNMKDTYKKLNLNCLFTLGGNGTHKTANLLSQEGLNIIGLPKTIDNDIWGTSVTFGFHSAVDIATDVIDRLHTTACSHSRLMVVEIMGNKAGWLTLYSGIAGGADCIVIPEIPFDIKKLVDAINKRTAEGKNFSIIAVAEGAYSKEEDAMKKKERIARRNNLGIHSAAEEIVKEIAAATSIDARLCVPGHMIRGGCPSAYDRILATKFGSYAAELLEKEKFGTTVALVNGIITSNKLTDIAGKTKLVNPDNQLVTTAKNVGISFGN